MSTTYITRALKIAVLPEREPIYSERATVIEIVDDAAGEYLRVSQSEESAIAFDAAEWLHIRAGIEQMLADIKTHEKK